MMEELGTSRIESSLQRIARTLADPAAAIDGLPSAVLVPAARRDELGPPRRSRRRPGAGPKCPHRQGLLRARCPPSRARLPHLLESSIGPASAR